MRKILLGIGLTQPSNKYSAQGFGGSVGGGGLRPFLGCVY